MVDAESPWSGWRGSSFWAASGGEAHGSAIGKSAGRRSRAARRVSPAAGIRNRPSSPSQRARLGPVEVELALGEQPGALFLDDGVAIAKVRDHQLPSAAL